MFYSLLRSFWYGVANVLIGISVKLWSILPLRVMQSQEWIYLFSLLRQEFLKMSKGKKSTTDITVRALWLFLCTCFIVSASLRFAQKVLNNDKILSIVFKTKPPNCTSESSASQQLWLCFSGFQIMRICWLSFLSVSHQQLPSSLKWKRSPSRKMNKSKRKRRRKR